MEDFEQIKAYNKELCAKYPWLVPRSAWTDEVIEDYDYEITELDFMPDGWRKAFGERMCAELQALLEEANYVDEYRIVQIKEKYGTLRWYDNGVPSSISGRFHAVIRHYEELSAHICISCGKSAKWITTDWISPYCDECASKISSEKKRIL